MRDGTNIPSWNQDAESRGTPQTARNRTKPHSRTSRCNIKAWMENVSAVAVVSLTLANNR